jgi:microcystin-dependent protein
VTDIVVPPTIQAMPPAPQPTDPEAVFDSKGFATVAAWPAFIDEANALAVATRTNAVAAQERAVSSAASSTSAASSATAAAAARDLAQAFAQSAINAPGSSGTSPSSIGIGSGNKVLTTQTGKAFVVGQTVTVAAAAAPTAQRMVGVITGYDSGTGVMNFFVPDGAFLGSGAPSSWIISLTAARDGLVQQGSGIGQSNNAVKLGWAASGAGKLLATVDSTDLGAIALESWVSAMVLESAPPGTRGEFYMNAPPTGWFKSNGAGLSVANHPRLFSRIGYFYGGSGDTFYLPNDNGLFSRSWDETGVYDPGRAFGSVQGPANLWHNHGGATHDAGWHNHSASIDAAGSHGHVVNDPGHNHQVSRYWGRAAARDRLASGEDVYQGTDATSFSGTGIWLSVDGYHNHGVSIGGNGLHGHGINGDGLSEARPWNRAVLVCIKY